MYGFSNYFAIFFCPIIGKFKSVPYFKIICYLCTEKAIKPLPNQGFGDV
jgi:hypothetical protein